MCTLLGAPLFSSYVGKALLLFHSTNADFGTIGEWRGLTVSVEDCHSKGRRFASPSCRHFLEKMARRKVARKSRAGP